jgi:CMP-N,N'-diacetyllegionaminic acid synthase
VKNKKILWVITARSGSKSIPNKNIKILGGNPLIKYIIESALNTDVSKDVWVSTDSKAYAKIALKFKAEVPFIRPSYLASDDASSFDVILHAMEYANKIGLKYDYIGHLEPTNPFIKSVHLENALFLLENTEDASSVVATIETRTNTIFIQEDSKYLKTLAKKLNNLRKLGRQNFKKEITPSGGLYISKWNDFLRNKSFYTQKTLSFEVDNITGLEIDEPIDWEFADFIINKLKNE